MPVRLTRRSLIWGQAACAFAQRIPSGVRQMLSVFRRIELAALGGTAFLSSSVLVSLPAVLTQARDGDLSQVGLKAVSSTQMVHKRTRFCHLYADELAARLAGKVKTWSVDPQKRVAALPVPNIYARNQGEFSEQAQCSVDGRNVHAGTDGLHPAMDLFGCGRSLYLVQDVQHHLALWGESEPTLSELPKKDFFASHVRVPFSGCCDCSCN